jgi:hypothetical protein
MIGIFLNIFQICGSLPHTRPLLGPWLVRSLTYLCRPCFSISASRSRSPFPTWPRSDPGTKQPEVTNTILSTPTASEAVAKWSAYPATCGDKGVDKVALESVEWVGKEIEAGLHHHGRDM